MIRLTRVDNKDVMRYDQTDLSYYNEDGKPVRMLVDDIMGNNSIAVAIYIEESHKEVVLQVSKDYAFYIDGNEAFKNHDMVVAETEDSRFIRGCVWTDKGSEGVDFYFLMDEDEDVAYSRTKRLRWARPMEVSERDALSETLKETGAIDALMYMDEAEKNVNPVPRHEFKIFDKVLARNDETHPWILGIFAYHDKDDDGDGYPYNVIPCDDTSRFKYCIPYEGNEGLTGTTNSINE